MGPKIDTAFGLFGLGVVVLLPAVVLYLMCRFFEDLNDKKFRASYGSLYEGLKTKSRWVILFRVWFLLRRLFLCVIVVRLRNLLIQILLFIAQETVNICILAFGRNKFHRHRWWRMEMWN